METRKPEAKKAGKGNASLFFLKKRKWMLILLVAFLILIFVAYRTWLNFHFFVADDLVLFLEPQDKSLSINYWEKPNVSFSINIQKNIFCNAYCSYEFKDISKQITEEKGAFTSKKSGNELNKQFQLFVDRTGSGQKIYSFRVQCNNIRTWYCPTNEKAREKSAFVTLNYDISEYEKFLKNTLKDNITKIADELSYIDIQMQELNNIFFELGFNANLNEIRSQKEILNNDFDMIVLEFKNLEKVWSKENYVLLSQLFNKSYDATILGIKERILSLNLKIDETVKKHNLIVRDLNNLDDTLRSMNETTLFLKRGNIENMLAEYKQLFGNVSALKTKILKNAFSGYASLDNEVKLTKEKIKNFEEKSGDLFKMIYLNGTYYNMLEESKLCAIKEDCLNKTNLPVSIKDSLAVNDAKSNGLCGFFQYINKTYKQYNNKSEEMGKNYEIDKLQNLLETAKKERLHFAAKKAYEKAVNLSVDSKEENNSLGIFINMSMTNLSAYEEINYGDFSKKEIMSLMQIELSNESLQYYERYCEDQEINISEYYEKKIDLNTAEMPKKGNFSSRINIALSENYPLCCVFGECKKCCMKDECKNDALLYPVLFLHGHSFNRDNNPDFSLDAFNKLQAKLEEDGYISAGTITPISNYSEVDYGNWGLSSNPLSLKGSYYLVSYYNVSSYSIATRKSENIEVYAIRLKEMIDLVKFRTAKDKVILITHSMGSLVARSYMQIFGDSSVYKTVMVAAPNKGISGTTSSYCPILGEKKECEDMLEDSIFIKKLNDPLKVPKHAKIYNIIGVGCDMEGKNGDGVVTKENAELEYSENYYINGTCSGFSEILHTQILDIEKYPKTYSIVRTILKQ